MKAKVIIENGHTTIVLTPENEFEINVLDTAYRKKERFTFNTNISATYNYGSFEKHKIEILIKESNQPGQQ